MGQLVHEGDPDPDGEGGPPHLDARLGGVVEGERAGIDHLVVGVEQVDVAGRQPQGAQLRGVALELFAVLVVERRLVFAGLRGVVRSREEVDVDRMVEGQTPLVLHEGGEVGDPGVPCVGVAGPAGAELDERGKGSEHPQAHGHDDDRDCPSGRPHVSDARPTATSSGSSDSGAATVAESSISLRPTR